MNRFAGFPQQGIDFLADLERNNNCEWFSQHKPIFQEFLETPYNTHIRMAKLGMRINPTELKRIPRGYNNGLPLETLLRRKGISVWSDHSIPVELKQPTVAKIVLSIIR